MREYEAPKLFVDSFVADTMIASSSAKNGKGEQCYGCNQISGEFSSTGNVCIYAPGSDEAGNAFC